MHPDIKDLRGVRLLFDHLASKLTAHTRGPI